MGSERIDEIRTAEYHTAGEPFRIVTRGVGGLGGVTVLDKREWCQAHLDSTRELLINEPRGHADMYGGFPTDPDDDGGDLGVVFFHKDGFSTACGHGTIALVTWAIEEGMISADPSSTVEVIVDVPSGRLRTEAAVDAAGRVESVRFWNVPAFVAAIDVDIESRWGELSADLSFGGAFYASVALDDSELGVNVESLTDLVTLSRDIRSLLVGHSAAVYQEDERLSGVYGVIFHETVGRSPLHQRNVTIFADGAIDRSPCGSGTSARLAILHARGDLVIGEPLTHEGIAGGLFKGIVEGSAQAGLHLTVDTSVEGSAYRTGSASFTIDQRDPIGRGFQLR